MSEEEYCADVCILDNCTFCPLRDAVGEDDFPEENLVTDEYDDEFNYLPF